MKQMCACHSQRPYSQCCQPFHLGKKRPLTPTELMRSRYSAYALGKTGYVIKTERAPSLSQTEQVARRRAIRQFSDTTQFVGLQIVSSETLSETKGTVTFRAILLQHGQDASYTEKSLFEKVNGRWRYIEAIADSRRSER